MEARIMHNRSRRFVRIAACIALIAAFTLTASLMLTGCGNGSTGAVFSTGGGEQGTWKTISAEEAKQMMDGDADAVILDVRSAEEFADGHIPGAALLPHTDITAESAAQAIPTKESTVLVYCRSGNRSATASETLAGLGYTQVYDFGGIRDWPYEVVAE